MTQFEPTPPMPSTVTSYQCQVPGHPPWVDTDARSECVVCRAISDAGDPPVGVALDTLTPPITVRVAASSDAGKFLRELGVEIAFRRGIAVRSARPVGRDAFVWPLAVVTGWRLAVLWDDQSDLAGGALRAAGWGTISVSAVGDGFTVSAALSSRERVASVSAASVADAARMVSSAVRDVQKYRARLRDLRVIG